MDEFEKRIRNRESWLRSIIIFGTFLIFFSLFVIFAWGIAVGVVQLHIGDLGFSELLSLILALFAITLSAVFYFKATETSNTFYDNTYKFTSEVSRILGEIQSGFDEQLHHLDKGNEYLRDKIDRMNTYPPNTKEIETEKEELQKKLNEQDEMIETFVQKEQSSSAEKEQFIRELSGKMDEIESLKGQISVLERQLGRHELSHSRKSVLSRMQRYFATRGINRLKILPEEFIGLSIDEVIDMFQSHSHSLNPAFISDLESVGFIMSDGTLSMRGAKFLQKAVKDAEMF